MHLCTRTLRRLFSLALAVFSATGALSTAMAQEHDALRLEDFAEAIAVMPEESGPIHSLILPEAVYRGSVNADFSDLRVFNREGLPVPHTIRSLGATEKSSRREENLRFFPLYAQEQQRQTGASVDLTAETNPDGSIIRVQVARNTDKPTNSPAERVVTSYLLDATGVQGLITALNITFKTSADRVTDYVLPLRVETSADLTHFRTIGHRQTLMRLSHEGESIEQSRFELTGVGLSAAEMRYMRLSWSGKLPAPLQFVRAETTVSAPQEHWESKQLTAQAVNSPESYIYDLAGSLPIDRLRVRLGEDNLLIQARVESADERTGPFEQLELRTYYRMKHQGTMLESPAHHVPRRHARFLRVSATRPGSSFGPQAPSIEIAHLADQLLFAERGSAPFQLAFGHHSAANSSLSLDELLAPLPPQLREALPLFDTALGEVRELAGASARTAAPPGLPWKKYLLWCVLVGAVTILGFAAFSLLRSQQSGAANSPKQP